VRFIDDCIGHKVFMATKKAPKGSVTLLENLRFYPGEEANDPAFAQQLAKQTHADYFVQDGFGVVHRAHASTSAITQFLPSVAGLLLEREYSVITKAMKHPEKPLVAVLGGAKVSDKIPIIKALEHAADTIIVGGAMANTFLARRGNFMGSSYIESDQAETIDAIYEAAAQKVGRQNADNYIVLPTDVGVGTSLELTATRLDVSVKAIPAGSYALDIGPDSIARMESIIAKARTVIWNGPLGMDELPTFAQASTRLAQLLAGRSDITPPPVDTCEKLSP
jgi:phosphoglycerate kinase